MVMLTGPSFFTPATQAVPGLSGALTSILDRDAGPVALAPPPSTFLPFGQVAVRVLNCPGATLLPSDTTDCQPLIPLGPEGPDGP